MDAFSTKSFTVSRGYTYSYHISPSSHDFDANAPTLFFAHGWPDDHTLWQFIAPHFLTSKFRIVAPDLLGVGESSKPTHLAAYNFKYITADFLELLDHEGITKVIVIGHDWGSLVVQRLWLYAPSQCAGMILLNVAYNPPSAQPFDLNAMNALTEKVFGYSLFTYFHFFTSAEGTRLMSAHPEKVWEICHGSDDKWKRFCTEEGAMEGYILDPGATVDLKGYAKDEQLRRHFVERVKRDGFETWQVYYRAWTTNLQYETERIEVPQENHVVGVPVLYVGCSGDAIARPDSIGVAREGGFLPGLEEAVVESGHWCVYERPQEVVEAIEGFLKRRFQLNAA